MRSSSISLHAGMLARKEEARLFGLRKRLRASVPSYLMLAPFMLIFFVFTVVPVVAAIALSFTNFNMLETPNFIGFLNYERMLLDDDIFKIVLQNTLIFAFITGPVGYVISFFSAWLINNLTRGMRTIMTFIYYSPVLVGNVYFVWTLLFSNDEKGWINGVLLQLGLANEPIAWLTDTKLMMGVLILVQLWSCLGAGFLSFIAGFQSLEQTLYEAAALDGVHNRWQELWYVTIPQMSSNLLFGAVMTISASFGISGIITNIAGSPTSQYKADTIMTYMYDTGSVRFEMGYASTLAVFLFALMLLTNFVITQALKRFSTD